MNPVIKSGWHRHARHIPSPNFDDRPAASLIDAIIIHAISLPPAQFGGQYIEDFFCNQLAADAHPYFEHIADMQVSSHFLIKRQGELIQFVATNKRAWHAGKSCLAGKTKVNDFSIGIELEGCDSEPFELEQYKQLATLTGSLLRAYPLVSLERIVGHNEIAPGRKTDPGPHFDWTYFKQLLKGEWSGEATSRSQNVPK